MRKSIGWLAGAVVAAAGWGQAAQAATAIEYGLVEQAILSFNGPAEQIDAKEFYLGSVTMPERFAGALDVVLGQKGELLGYTIQPDVRMTIDAKRSDRNGLVAQESNILGLLGTVNATYVNDAGESFEESVYLAYGGQLLEQQEIFDAIAFAADENGAALAKGVQLYGVREIFTGSYEVISALTFDLSLSAAAGADGQIGIISIKEGKRIAWSKGEQPAIYSQTVDLDATGDIGVFDAPEPGMLGLALFGAGAFFARSRRAG